MFATTVQAMTSVKTAEGQSVINIFSREEEEMAAETTEEVAEVNLKKDINRIAEDYNQSKHEYLRSKGRQKT